MNRLAKVLSDWKGDRFIRNIGWMGISELVIRVFRLGTTVVLARFLSPEDYGLAAIVLTTHEFIRVFTRNGIADKIVQSDASELEETCRTAYGLNWLIASALFTVQCFAAFAIAKIYNDSHLLLPIFLVAVTYLIYPIASIQTALIRRENRLKILSFIFSVQVSIDNILTAIFALLGWGMWAIVLPKLLVAPIWIVMSFKYHPWRMKKPFSLTKWRSITSFSTQILGIELLTTLRENVDYLLIGRFVSVQALGVYYFAFNAGLGLSLGLINSIQFSLFSDLCDIKTNFNLFIDKYTKSLQKIALLIFPVVILQSSLAPFYVPLVFGHKWIEQGAIPILILICCSALSRPFAEAASLMFRALGCPNIELRWNIAFTVCLTVAIWVGTYWGILGAAIAVTLTHLILQPIYTWWATRQVLQPSFREMVS